MKKEFKKISLSGDWKMDYLFDGEYKSNILPKMNGTYIKGAVPAYWEDILPTLQQTFLYKKLKYNPDYKPLDYPMAAYVHDMPLPTIYGCFSYSREFTLDSLEGVCKAKLFIDGAHNTVKVWINGSYVGEHIGYSAPFDFELDKSLLNIGKNEITLTVSNLHKGGYKNRVVSGCTSRAANNYTGGIYGDVEIRLYEGVISDAYITTDSDLKHFTVHAVKDSEAQIRVEILDGEKIMAEATLEDSEESVAISTEGFELWSVDNPKRYTCRLISGKQSVTRKFGIRRLVAEDTRLKLNGNYIFLRGICEHGYYPLTVHPPRDKNYYRNVIRTLKGLGFNFVRFHTWVPMPEYLEAADELGMLMEVETPNNTTYREWVEVVKACRKYTSCVMYSSGNEMIIDEDYIEHLKKCASLVHENTDSLFSPMSAMRGIEYFDYGKDRVDEPFPHNPVRLKVLGEFCDLYNSYANMQLSYTSASADPANIDRCNAVYKKPLLSHEICINGTYCDLSLKDRYKDSRIGKTAFFTSIEKHLTDKGVIDNAPLYYKNSVQWQRRLRKQCFESSRLSKSLAGYDFLGDIDHHWHTFGYHVGMMNEFYELKPGETRENVLRYNSDSVLLADMPYSVNFEAKQNVTIPIHISNYSHDFDNLNLHISLVMDGKSIIRKDVKVSNVKAGAVTRLCDFTFKTPDVSVAKAMKLKVKAYADDIEADNEWELYAYPKAAKQVSKQALYKEKGLMVTEDISEEKLIKTLEGGKDVLLFGVGPFAHLKTNWQISLAGRTAGHLATVIKDTPLMDGFPNEGFCGYQFKPMLNGGSAVVLDLCDTVPFDPIIEAVSSYKFVHREAIIFEYRVANARLLVCTLNLDENDAGARYLKEKIINYATSSDFNPKHTLTRDMLYTLFNTNPVFAEENTNMARNNNDITA